MENQDLLLCPVCSLYLREGISLKNHLQTHSKEKVIEALLKQNPLTANIEHSVEPTSSSASQDSTLLPNVSNANLGFHRDAVGIVPTAPSFIEPSSSQQLTPTIQCNSSTIPCINNVQFSTTSSSSVIASSGISNAYSYHQLISNEGNIILIPVYNVGPTSVIVPNNMVPNSIVNSCVVVPSNQSLSIVNGTPVTSTDVFSAANDNGLPQMSARTDEPSNDDSVTESSDNAKISSNAEEEEKETDDEVANIFNRTLQEASSAKQSEVEYLPTTPNKALYSAPDAENAEQPEKGNNQAPSAAVSVIRVHSNLNSEDSSPFQEDESHEMAATDSSVEPFSPISSPCYPVSLQTEATSDLNKCGKYSLPGGSEENMRSMEPQSDAGNYDFVISNSDNAMHILPDSSESLQCGRENDQYILPNDEIPRSCSFDAKTKSDYNFLGIGNSFLSSVSLLSSVNKTMFADVDVYNSAKCKSNADQQKGVKLNPKIEESSVIVQSNGRNAMEKEPTGRNSSELESAGSSSISPFNIQTDESMPPRGELSGQESLSGTETPLWQMLHRPENFNTACQSDNKESMKIDFDSIISEVSGDKDSVKANNEKLIAKSEFSVEKITSSSSSNADKKVAQREFICVYCRTKFSSWKQRMTHIADSHADEDGLTVDTLFGKRLRLKLESANKEESPEQKYNAQERPASPNYMICRICDKSLMTTLEFLEHLKEAHDIRKRSCVCPTCFVSFASSGEYQEHIRKVHPYECLSCGKKFYTRAGYMLHQKRHMKIKPYSCNDCDKSFVTKQKLVEHVNVHTGENPIKCEVCGCQFKRYSNYQQHKKYVHLNHKRKTKDLVCDCGEVFHSKGRLQWHQETHDEKPKQCPFCVERFVHAASLTRHIRKCHNETYVSGWMKKGNLVECPVCNVYYLHSSLQTHMKIHANEKPFACTECSHRFRTKWNLQLHKWTHVSRSAKPFKCKLCVKAYIHKIDFDAHMRSHNNCRPYSCNVCGRQFIRKYNCIRHMREHEEPRAFKCNTCGKLFSRSYYLTEHEKVHTGEKPHVCHICGKASATKSNHNKHVKMHNVVRESMNMES